jgi:hypothetical protein
VLELVVADAPPAIVVVGGRIAALGLQRPVRSTRGVVPRRSPASDVERPRYED